MTTKATLTSTLPCSVAVLLLLTVGYAAPTAPFAVTLGLMAALVANVMQLAANLNVPTRALLVSALGFGTAALLLMAVGLTQEDAAILFASSAFFAITTAMLALGSFRLRADKAQREGNSVASSRGGVG